MITHRAIKHYILLLAFALMIFLLLFGLNKISPSFFPVNNILLLTGGFAVISMAALVIFFHGTEGNGEKRVFTTSDCHWCQNVAVICSGSVVHCGL